LAPSFCLWAKWYKKTMGEIILALRVP